VSSCAAANVCASPRRRSLLFDCIRNILSVPWAGASQAPPVRFLSCVTHASIPLAAGARVLVKKPALWAFLDDWKRRGSSSECAALLYPERSATSATSATSLSSPPPGVFLLAPSSPETTPDGAEHTSPLRTARAGAVLRVRAW
jgi:hypothetical protein